MGTGRKGKMPKKLITVTWCEELGRWIFVLGTTRGESEKIITIGMTDEHLYSDDPPSMILKAAARWIKKISPNTTGYEIHYSDPNVLPKSSLKLKNIIQRSWPS